jgi:hypothetical protein
MNVHIIIVGLHEPVPMDISFVNIYFLTKRSNECPYYHRGFARTGSYGHFMGKIHNRRAKIIN